MRPGSLPHVGWLIALAMLIAGCQAVSRAQASCPVTTPNGIAPAGEAPSPLHHSQAGLTTALWPGGVVPFDQGGPGELRDDGSLAMKFPFWRGQGIAGALTITGRRLDGPSSPAYGEIPSGYGDTGFQASAIVFPSTGCWEVTAKAGDAQMTFVQKVVRLRD